MHQQPLLNQCLSLIILLGLTLGVLLCVLTLSNLMILKPLPYSDQDRLYVVNQSASDHSMQTSDLAFSYPAATHLYKKQTIFDDSALSFYHNSVLTSHPIQPTLSTTYVTPEWFSLFNMQMELGRHFNDKESIGASNPVAVLGYQTWKELYDGDKSIIGKSFTLRDVNFKVVGVTSEDFNEPQIYEPGLKTDVWLAWDFIPKFVSKPNLWDTRLDSLLFVGKLQEGTSYSQAEQLISPLSNAVWQEGVADKPFYKNWSIKLKLETLRSKLLGDLTTIIYFLIAAAIGLILIASANVTNLLASRIAEQQRKHAISAVLGAKKIHLFKSIFIEIFILMLLSILIALFIASLGFHLFQQYLGQIFPRTNELSIDSFTLIFSTIFVVFFSFTFAWISSKIVEVGRLNDMLHSSGKGTSGQISKRIRKTLIITQVAIASLLVFLNLSLMNEAIDVIKTPSGIATNNIYDIQLTINRRPTDEEKKGPSLADSLRKNLSLLPQVKSVSRGKSPFSGFKEVAATDLKSNKNFVTEIKKSDKTYFESINQKLLQGRYFSEADNTDRNKVTIINNQLAEYLYPNKSILGQRLKITDGSEYTVVGVVTNVLIPGDNDRPNRIYIPASVHEIGMMLKLRDNQQISREQLVNNIKEVTSLFSIFSINKVDDLSNQLLFNKYVTAVTSAVLTIFSLFLATIGLYGILSYSTLMRRTEIGTRMAIGAKRSSIVTLFIKDYGSSALYGLAISIIIMLSTFIFFSEKLSTYISPNLSYSALISILLILLTVAFACYWPLRKFIYKPIIFSLRGLD